MTITARSPKFSLAELSAEDYRLKGFIKPQPSGTQRISGVNQNKQVVGLSRGGPFLFPGLLLGERGHE